MLDGTAFLYSILFLLLKWWTMVMRRPVFKD